MLNATIDHARTRAQADNAGPSSLELPSALKVAPLDGQAWRSSRATARIEWFRTASLAMGAGVESRERLSPSLIDLSRVKPLSLQLLDDVHPYALIALSPPLLQLVMHVAAVTRRG